MDLGQFGDILTATAKEFYNKQLITHIVPQYESAYMVNGIIRKVLEPYIAMLEQELSNDLSQTIWEKLHTFVPEATRHMCIGSRINEIDNTDVLTEKNAVAILVAFVNQICPTLDLGLRSCDVVKS